MKTLTQIGLNKQASRFIDSISHAEYTINGATGTIDIFKTSIEGDVVKIFVYFDDSVDGDVGNVKLVDKDGDVVAEAERTFNKPQTKGLYVAFRYKFTEMEVEASGIQ